MKQALRMFLKYIEILKTCQEKINILKNMTKQNEQQFEMNPKQVVPDHCQ